MNPQSRRNNFSNSTTAGASSFTNSTSYGGGKLGGRSGGGETKGGAGAAAEPVEIGPDGLPIKKKKRKNLSTADKRARMARLQK